MKLENTNIDSLDLSKEENKNKWAEKALDSLDIKIPIMTSIAKNTESTHFNYIGLARHASYAESLIHKTARFRTTSEVYRAAMYIGMSFLHNLFKDEGTAEQKARATQIYKTIEIMESLNHSLQSIDAVVCAAKKMIECGDGGVIDYEEMWEKITLLVDSLPVELRKTTHEKIKRVRKGDSIVDIAETKIQRGVKGMKWRV